MRLVDHKHPQICTNACRVIVCLARNGTCVISAASSIKFSFVEKLQSTFLKLEGLEPFFILAAHTNRVCQYDAALGLQALSKNGREVSAALNSSLTISSQREPSGWSWSWRCI